MSDCSFVYEEYLSSEISQIKFAFWGQWFPVAGLTIENLALDGMKTATPIRTLPQDCIGEVNTSLCEDSRRLRINLSVKNNQTFRETLAIQMFELRDQRTKRNGKTLEMDHGIQMSKRIPTFDLF